MYPCMHWMMSVFFSRMNEWCAHISRGSSVSVAIFTLLFLAHCTICFVTCMLCQKIFVFAPPNPVSLLHSALCPGKLVCMGTSIGLIHGQISFHNSVSSSTFKILPEVLKEVDSDMFCGATIPNNSWFVGSDKRWCGLCY